jgi:predicted methyltransferase
MMNNTRRGLNLRRLGLLGALMISISALCIPDARALPLPKSDAQTLKLLDAAIAGEHRSAKNKARDTYRHPRETLQFFGLRKDMSVIEIAPGSGWYTEVLAPVVKDHGHYAAGITPPASADAEDTAGMKALKQKFADHASVLGTLNTAPFGPGVTDMAPAGSVDMVMTFRNLHNWMGSNWADKAIALMFKALKPGGILGIEEHRGNPAKPQDPKAESGYVNEDYAIKLFEAAGFKLVGRSEVNANAKDTKDYKEGVWTLLPTLTLGETDKAKYQAIGESDRFTLKFQKP